MCNPAEQTPLLWTEERRRRWLPSLGASLLWLYLKEQARREMAAKTMPAQTRRALRQPALPPGWAS
jgi:hypothetical protein